MLNRKSNKLRVLLKNVRNNPSLYLMSIPALFLIVLFCYVPMVGVIMAFEEYSFAEGLFGSPWIGFTNFQLFFNSFYFKDVLLNTFLISLYSLVVGFGVPIIFALIIHSLGKSIVSKIIKVLVIIPYFISTVVMVSLIRIFFNGYNGIVNTFFESIGLMTKDYIDDPNSFYSLFVWTDLWQGLGWNSIIYISVLGGVPSELYDAAKLDGANKFKVLCHIDFPQLVPTITTLLVLALGGLFSVGFEKIYLMQTTLNSVRSEVISTYVYKMGVLNQDYGFGTAVGLFNSVICFILLVLSNTIVRKFSDYSLW